MQKMKNIIVTGKMKIFMPNGHRSSSEQPKSKRKSENMLSEEKKVSYSQN